MADRDFERLIGALDARSIGFGDAVAISGIEARQFRNSLDRGVLRIGEKLESVSRWVFSLRDCLQLIVIADLTRQTWTPVAQAAQIAALVAPHTERFLRSSLEAGVENAIDIQLAAFATGESIRVVEGRRGTDGGGVFELDGTRVGDWRHLDSAHVRLRFFGVMDRLIKGVEAVRG